MRQPSAAAHILVFALAIASALAQSACSACGLRSEPTQRQTNSPSVRERAKPVASHSVPSRPRSIERVLLKLADATTHTAILSFPEKRASRLPAVIVLGGFETGEKSLDFMREDLDIIYATADYPYKAPKQRNLVQSLRQIPAIRRAIRQTDLIVDALIDRLQNDPRVDSDRMTFVGASFGAPFAITAAIRKPEIDGIVLIHAFGRGDLVVARQLANAWGKWSCPFSWLLGKVAWALLNYSAPELDVLALRPHQKVLCIYSEVDEQLPDESIRSLLEGLHQSAAQVTILKTTGGHIAPDKNAMIEQLMDDSLEWLKGRNLL